MSRLHRLAAIAVAAIALGCGADSPGDSDGAGTGGSTGSDAGETTGGSTAAAEMTGKTEGAGTSGTTGDDAFEECAGASEAHAVFDAFWQTLDQDYALFDIRLPDTTWDVVGAEACGQLGADTTPDALFDLLIATAERLDDGHVQLEAADLGRDGDGWVSEYPHDDLLYDLELNVEARYLDGELTWAADDWFAWGQIGSIGYLSITSLDELSPGGDEDDDVARARTTMDSVLQDLGESRAIIIDVRANGGGWDAVALEVARWFAGPEAIAWSEQVRDGPDHLDFSDWEDTYVEASDAEGYAGPVIVLSSGGTFSAGEVFLLAMRVRDRVTILGEASSGHLSDIYGATLPNGWELGYSAERYRAADGEIYEARGVPPDVSVEFDAVAFEAGVDVMLEAALAELGA